MIVSATITLDITAQTMTNIHGLTQPNTDQHREKLCRNCALVHRLQGPEIKRSIYVTSSDIFKVHGSSSSVNNRDQTTQTIAKATGRFHRANKTTTPTDNNLNFPSAMQAEPTNSPRPKTDKDMSLSFKSHVSNEMPNYL